MILKVNKDICEIKQNEVWNVGDYNVHTVQVELSEEFDGLVNKVRYFVEDNNYDMLITDNVAEVPREATLTEGIIRIGVYGYDADTNILVQSTSPVNKYIASGTYTGEADNTEPLTPTDKQQMETAIQKNTNDITDLKANKQDKLISGVNIKTINNESILSGGNITLVEEETDPIFTNSPAYSITDNDITYWNNKANVSDIPDVSNFITNTVDDLVNYYKKSETFTKQEVNNLISAITTMNIKVVQTLPTQDISTTTIYLVPKTTAETNDAYDEYIYVSNAWEHIGSTEVDLTNYVTNTDYATASVGGVLKVSNGDYGITVDEGVLKGTVRTYAQYNNMSSKGLVCKGTLENVITGKDLATSTDLASKQNITDNTLTTTNKTIPTAINEVNSIAKGANQAIGYSDYQTMITAINSLSGDEYNVGQNVYIVTVNVPDLWVSSVESTSSTYTYVDDATVINDLETNGYIQVGYYKLSMLETQKVDLTNYITNTDYAGTNKVGVIRTNPDYGTSITSVGALISATKTYQQYQDTTTPNMFISKGTLENVITGKGLVSNTDYASYNTGGIIMLNGNYGTGISNGYLRSLSKTYTDYSNASDYLFISKGTLENVITGKGLEVTSNKVTTISSSSTNTQYPSAKLFYDTTTDLQTENERLKATLPTTTGEGQDITLNKTAELDFVKPPLPRGNSEQEGEPRPDNAVPITNVTGNVEVTISNENNTESKTLPVSLGNIELCKIGNYQDYLYKNNGKWYKYNAINKLVLNGSENWSVSNNVFYLASISDYINSSGKICLSDKYTAINNTDIGTSAITQNNSICFFITNTNPRLYIRDERFNNVNAFKAELSENNVKVYYPTVTPTDTEITDATLISQLEEISKTLSYQGQTNITSNTIALFNVEAYQSTKLILENLDSRLTLVEG